MIIVFMFKTATPRMEKDYNGNPKEVYDDVHIKFKADKEFLTAYYRDEMKAKGIDADYDVRLATINTTKEIQLTTIQKVQLIIIWVMVVVMM